MRSLFPLAAILVAACIAPAGRPTPPATAAAPTRSPALVTLAPTTTPTPLPTLSPVPVIRYVAIGASDTVGVGASDPATGSWPARLATLLPGGSEYSSVGVSGSLAAQARTEQLPTALARRPTVVTVWLAVNDLNASIEPAQYADTLRSIVDALAAGTEARIFVGNVPDLRSLPAYASTDKAALLARITAYNDAIAAIAATRTGRVTVVDLFTGSAALVSTMTVAADGFHPSDAGYQLIADRFAGAMRAAGIPIRAG